MKKIACLLLLIQSGFIMAQTETLVTINGKKVEFNPFADNGLSLFNSSIQLGGSLTKPSLLTTTAANTLTIEGLQQGTPYNNILLTDSAGVLKIIDASTFVWNLPGNTGTDPANNFVGTTDNKPVLFRINNINAGKISAESTAFGYKSLNPASIGIENTAIGNSALATNTEGFSNTALGGTALGTNLTGSSNTAVGNSALWMNKAGNLNTAAGSSALSRNNGNSNTALGVQALSSNTTGDENTAVGQQAMYMNTTGAYNAVIGPRVLTNIATGTQNVAVGSNAGSFYGNNVPITKADNSVFIGYGCKPNGDSQTNEIMIGFQAIGRGSNTVQIGDGNITSIWGQVAWSNPSDVRLKKDIQDSQFGLNFIKKLRPVTYKMKTGATDLQSGFIAQEVEAAANSIHYQFSGIVKPQTDADFYSLRYSEFVVPLVKAVQEQQKVIEEQDRFADAQDQLLVSKNAKLAELKKRLLRLEEKIK